MGKMELSVLQNPIWFPETAAATFFIGECYTCLMHLVEFVIATGAHPRYNLQLSLYIIIVIPCLLVVVTEISRFFNTILF